MPVDRELWSQNWLTKTYNPAWTCPTCGRGSVSLNADTLHHPSDFDTRRYFEDGGDDPESWTGRFCCILTCSNQACREVVAAAGRASQERNELSGEVYMVFNPECFSPPVPLFPIPGQCPSDVTAELKAAFAVFWSDLPALMNHLRKAVEVIMDHLRVRKEFVITGKDGKRHYRRYTLHDRIVQFAKKDAKSAERLLALKWLGNESSHGKGVTKDDAFDGFDLIEDFIRDHFEKRGKKIVALAKSINRRRKPRSQ
jgi:hypothetical protein